MSARIAEFLFCVHVLDAELFQAGDGDNLRAGENGRIMKSQSSCIITNRLHHHRNRRYQFLHQHPDRLGSLRISSQPRPRPIRA